MLKYQTPQTKSPGRLDLKTKITIRKFVNDEAKNQNRPFQVITREGNLGLNEGIQLALDLMIGAGGTAWDYTNSYLGVGDTTSDAAAAQLGLQAATVATSSLYVAMDATSYPSRSGQILSWRSTYGATQANFAWNEFTVANSDSNAGTNLIRKVSVEGTKTSGQSWELTIDVIMS